MDFMTAFSICMKNVIMILIGIVLNLYSAFGTMAILTLLILPICGEFSMSSMGERKNFCQRVVPGFD